MRVVAGWTRFLLPVSIAAIVARPTSDIFASSIWVSPRRFLCSLIRDKIMGKLSRISIAFKATI